MKGLSVVDNFLNSITMYRLVLYGLILLSAISITFGFLQVLPYAGHIYILTLLIILVSSFVSNFGIAKILRAPLNSESWLITALILFFILAPVMDTRDVVITAVASVIAMVSKYALAVNKKHIFNPAAFAVFMLSLFGFGNAIWWVGSAVLLPFVFVVGILVVRKIRRFSLFLTFMAAAMYAIVMFSYGLSMPILESISLAFTSWPLIFFGTIMLTEPLTSPSRRTFQMVYGGIVGALFGAQFHIGPLSASPEFALLIGNIFSFIVSPQYKLFAHFKEKRPLGLDLVEFVFSKSPDFKFIPGQYLEWTLPNFKPDSRGNRRYFTIASSPTEPDLRLGVKIAPENSSAFKKKLNTLSPNDIIVASQLSGDFVMPRDSSKKLAFIAGGIGITPFRSMIAYLIDKNLKRDIVLFYTASHVEEFAYHEIFDMAEQQFGLKVVYVITNKENAPSNWVGETGRLNDEMIKKYTPDYAQRTFYLSGPNAMVEGYKKLLLSLKISRRKIVTDYFPGF